MECVAHQVSIGEATALQDAYLQRASSQRKDLSEAFSSEQMSQNLSDASGYQAAYLLV